MGFGEKPDLATGRTLDLDKTYRIIIKKAVEAAGLECVRADDVVHSGPIETPMYQLLLDADVVVADLSTSNPNAIYELGVRHALRPHTTIVMAEKQYKFPFDLGHQLVRAYEHLGKGIDAEEAEQVREELTAAIKKLLASPAVDSPVYTFLPRLQAWDARMPATALAAAVASVAAPAAVAVAAAVDAPVVAPPADEQAASTLLDMFYECRKDGDWAGAVRVLRKLLEKRPNDAFLKQQLALATYKSKKPDAATAFEEAKTILTELAPHVNNDHETLGLWGGLHKRLWELHQRREDLEEAIWAHEKGFYLREDHYNGINLAFLLNVRAAISPPREATADTVVAERVRRRVAAVCEKRLETPIKDDEGNVDQEETFWVRASLVEALIGSGDTPQGSVLRAAVVGEAPEPWMAESMNEQLTKLENLLAQAPA
jgi:tetratricopeptide (TPR) repeat protein